MRSRTARGRIIALVTRDLTEASSFWPEFQSAVLGRKDAKTALADAERRVARELRRA